MARESWIEGITCSIHSENDDSRNINLYGVDPQLYEVSLKQVVVSPRLRDCLIKALLDFGLSADDFNSMERHNIPYQPDMTA